VAAASPVTSTFTVQSRSAVVVCSPDFSTEAKSGVADTNQLTRILAAEGVDSVRRVQMITRSGIESPLATLCANGSGSTSGKSKPAGSSRLPMGPGSVPGPVPGSSVLLLGSGAVLPPA
jgi:hypothetical protein